MSKVLFSIDQGTTSTRTLIFTEKGDLLFTAQEEFPQIYPADGWVEHDPEAIWETTLSTLRQAYSYARTHNYKIIALGITNQRETTLIWNRKTGKPIYNAIVWQDRRTAEICHKLKSEYKESELNAKTGLLLDPYFSATKAAWILDHVEHARAQATRGELAFGTVDTFLIWRLTGGKVHASDATNACRTNLFNIHSQDWDQDLLNLFNVPKSILPEVKNSADDFGKTSPDLLDESIPILGVAGDQQAAAIGQCCFSKGDIKSTYGTGGFIILNTGNECVTSKNRLLSTVCYRLEGKTTYALEGSIFIAGAAIQWLRDGLEIIKNASETQAMCESISSNNNIYFVPAFTGLGAPHWNPDARGAIYGLTRNTSRAEIARAAVESVVYQTYDLFEALNDDGVMPKRLKIDGGMAHNSWMAQHLASILNIPVDRPKILETTALGVAYLAGLQAGLYKSLDELKHAQQLDQQFLPMIINEDRLSLIEGWQIAVKRTLMEN